MATTTTERRATAATASSNQLLLRLYLSSLSTASKVIVKHGVAQRRQQAAGVGGVGAFRCKTCGRSFPTFQALGGHRTSHKRPLVRAHGLDLLLGARPVKGPAAVASDEHRCGHCGTVFPTGQALGGHMRRHRAAAAFDVAVAVHGEDETTARVVDVLSGELFHGESEDDIAGPVRLFKFI